MTKEKVMDHDVKAVGVCSESVSDDPWLTVVGGLKLRSVLS